MYIGTPNLFIYISVGTGLIYGFSHLCIVKKTPNLTDIFQVMLSTAAAYSAIELCYFVLEGSKSLGDFQESKLIIILGAISVIWVSAVSIVNLIKGELT